MTRIDELRELIESDMARCKNLFMLASDARQRKAEAHYFGALQCLTCAKTAKTVGEMASLILQGRVSVKLGLEYENKMKAESRRGIL